MEEVEREGVMVVVRERNHMIEGRDGWEKKIKVKG